MLKKIERNCQTEDVYYIGERLREAGHITQEGIQVYRAKDNGNSSYVGLYPTQKGMVWLRHIQNYTGNDGIHVVVLSIPQREMDHVLSLKGDYIPRRTVDSIENNTAKIVRRGVHPKDEVTEMILKWIAPEKTE